jgi:hypothetical protein
MTVKERRYKQAPTLNPTPIHTRPAVGLAAAGVYIEHDGRLCPPRMHQIDPNSEQRGRCGEVGLTG